MKPDYRNRFPVACISLFVAASMGFLLAGCGSILETQRPADERYWLEPLVENPSRPLEGLGLQFDLRVVPGLDSERVLVLGPDARLSQLGQARWADSLPDVLHSVMTRSLANQGAEPGSTSAGDRCLLKIEVQEFFAEGSPAVSVSSLMTGQFDCRGEKVAIRLAQSVDVGGDHASIIAAFQQALDRSMRDLMSRLEDSVVRVPGP